MYLFIKHAFLMIPNIFINMRYSNHFYNSNRSTNGQQGPKGLYVGNGKTPEHLHDGPVSG